MINCYRAIGAMKHFNKFIDAGQSNQRSLPVPLHYAAQIYRVNGGEKEKTLENLRNFSHKIHLCRQWFGAI
jgi:hypothetical protein